MRHGTIETPAFNNTNPNNLLSNGDFSHWTAGDNMAPDYWMFSGAPSVLAKESTIVKLGIYSTKLSKVIDNGSVDTSSYHGLSDPTMYQPAHESKGVEYWRNRFVTFGCWIWCDVADTACLLIEDTVVSISSAHPGDSQWHWITITRQIVNDAPGVWPQLAILGRTASAYYSGAIVVEGTSAFAYSNLVVPEAQNGEVNPTNVVPDYIGQIYVNTIPTTGSRGIFVAYGLGVGEWVDITIVLYGPDVTDPAFASASSYL